MRLRLIPPLCIQAAIRARHQLRSLMNFRLSFSAILTLMSLLLSAMPGLAQTPLVGPIVRTIEVQYAGSQTISKEKILANMRTKVGKPYSETSVEEDIRSLYATGNVDNVRIFGEPLSDGVKVIVVIAAKAQVSEVVINGVSELKPSRVRKQITMKAGDTLNEATIEEDRQKILEYYRTHGYTDVTVKVSTEIDEKEGKGRVIFEVLEGTKMTVRNVTFEGNNAFTSKQLSKVVKTARKTIFNILTKAGHVDSEQLDQDLQALRDFYQDKGYIEVQVQPARIDHFGKKVDVIFPLVEGPQYHVGTVTFDGVQVFTTDEIERVTKLKTGSVYSPTAIKADIKAIQDLYGARGYVDFEAAAATTPQGDHVMNLTYTFTEGAQSYVEHINISGNTRTKDKVIRREIALAPGDVFNTVRVDASKQRLQNLNYFSKTDLFPVDTLIPGRKDLNVLVEEKRTGSFNFGAGFSSIDSLLGFAEITQSNFDLLKWPNFTGGGQKFRARLQYGTERKDFIMSLTEPYFLDYKLSVGGELFYREASYVSDVYSERRYGGSLNARKALGDFVSARVGYKLEDVGIFNLADGVTEQIQQQADLGMLLESQINAGLNYDSRDSVFLTRKGIKADAGALVSGGPLGGDTQIYGFNLEATKYMLLPGDTILTIIGEISTVTNWGGPNGVPIWDRLYLGGANNMRGFKYREVGPKDDHGEPLGGSTLARATIEYTFPIIEKVRGAVFYDVGFVNAGSYDFSPTEEPNGSGGLAQDAGIGLRVELPIGPIRIDYGIPLQNDAYAGDGGHFNFNIGYQF